MCECTEWRHYTSYERKEQEALHLAYQPAKELTEEEKLAEKREISLSIINTALACVPENIVLEAVEAYLNRRGKTIYEP